mgnify:CR=1 FL=1
MTAEPEPPPMNIFLTPVFIPEPALYPTAVLKLSPEEPLFACNNACQPTAVLLFPCCSALNAPYPKAVFPSESVIASPAIPPIRVFSVAVVVAVPAS